MIALKYKVKISIDPVHSWGDRTIDEIFIPSINACINAEFAFSSDSPRDTGTEEIFLSKKDVNTIDQYVKLQQKIEKIQKRIFKND
jgi:hypothetical protein